MGVSRAINYEIIELTIKEKYIFNQILFAYPSCHGSLYIYILITYIFLKQYKRYPLSL